MKVTWHANFDQLKTDWLILPVFFGKMDLGKESRLWPPALARWLSELDLTNQFQGEVAEFLAFRQKWLDGFAHVALIDLGEKEEVSGYEIRWAFAKVVKEINRVKGATVCVAFDPLSQLPQVNLENSIEAVLEGLSLGAYQYQVFKTKKIQTFELAQVAFVSSSQKISDKKLAAVAHLAKIACEVTNHARNLVNEPATLLNPTALCRYVQKVFAGSQVLVTILGKSELAKLKAGGILSVADGGNQPPALIKMEYAGDPSSKRKIGLVGKGVMFDSGGYCLKNFPSISDMKCDMGGGAAVVSAMEAVSRLKPKINILALVPAVENLVSETATKPGDVVRMLNGASVEVVNTDAEGRLILADALAYACAQKVDRLIDLATLTGGCVVALGEEISGLFSNDLGLAADLTKAAQNAGEYLSPLPLHRHYTKLFESYIADMGNVGPKWGAAITAALFLQKYVDKKVKWAHIDIAGSAFSNTGFAYNPKGGTGVMVRTIIKFLMASA